MVYIKNLLVNVQKYQLTMKTDMSALENIATVFMIWSGSDDLFCHFQKQNFVLVLGSDSGAPILDAAY